VNHLSHSADTVIVIIVDDDDNKNNNNSGLLDGTAAKNKNIVHQFMGCVKTKKQKAPNKSRDMTPLTIFMLYFASARDNNKHYKDEHNEPLSSFPAITNYNFFSFNTQMSMIYQTNFRTTGKGRNYCSHASSTIQ